MNIVIIEYNAGNIYSVVYALKRLGINPVVTADKAEILSADKIIFPGVGEAKTTMDYLKYHQLDQLLIHIKQPLLGICLGMQLMCKSSEEGNVDCLGIFDAPVLKFHPEKHEDKIPHMGWNTISNLKSNLYKNLTDNEFVYFVHSYYVPIIENTIAETNYIGNFSASLHKNNFYATQFHPEKSGKTGEKILKNFLEL
ncbi:MAG: imidazole glycerol phosphate synthase subunit HisH [Dysgonamonadaceae bacterium]|jgi:glutamine amidotransferase|nr:imidazole glycerol phosphate synthase subunit HisH [Dysgonamonadaceae bacterium]